MNKSILRALIAIAAVFSLSLMTAAPARADAAAGSWSDNHQLCQSSSCVRSGNIVRLWQAIVWADDLSGNVGTSFIDGEFGSNTAAKTRTWQDVMNVGIDGSVGPETWGEAYGAVNRNTGFDTSTQTGYFYYGYNRTFGLRKQNSNGVWTFLNPRTGTWTGTSH